AGAGSQYAWCGLLSSAWRMPANDGIPYRGHNDAIDAGCLAAMDAWFALGAWPAGLLGANRDDTREQPLRVFHGERLPGNARWRTFGSDLLPATGPLSG